MIFDMSANSLNTSWEMMIPMAYDYCMIQGSPLSRQNVVCYVKITSSYHKLCTAVVEKFTYLVCKSFEKIDIHYHANIKFANFAMNRLGTSIFIPTLNKS